MSTILSTKSIYYKDINLIAQCSSINSRSKVPTELSRIIVSPMQAVVGKTFAIESNKLGLTTCLHRFSSIESELDILNNLDNVDNVFVSIGMNDIDRAIKLSNAGATNFLIDIANGYIPNLREYIHDLKHKINIKNIMVGNVMTSAGFYNAIIYDINTYVRVGIGNGSACGTSEVTGYNRGQITELMEIKELYDRMGSTCGCEKYIVADGGIKDAGCAAKAFGSGAQFVMLGGYFSKALEAETHIIGDGTYWGGASYKQQKLCGGIKKHSEGKVIEIDQQEVKPLKQLVDELWGGLSSAVSYSGYKSLTDFIGNGVFELKA